MWEKQGGICPYTGWKLVLLPCTTDYESTPLTTNRASVDRIDSSQGYTTDNIQFVAVIANFAKMAFAEEDLINFCQDVYKYRNLDLDNFIQRDVASCIYTNLFSGNRRDEYSPFRQHLKLARRRKYVPIVSVAIELVKFDMQKMEKTDISGVEYQQGTLAGYTIREALLEHWGRECVYCGEKHEPLEIEHIKSKSKGGSNRFSNLTLSCHNCNLAKGNKSIEEYLADRPNILLKVTSHQKKALSDAAAVNSTRNAIFEMANRFGLVLKSGDGASTKMTRIKSDLPKEHWIDSACVATDEVVKLIVIQIRTQEVHSTIQLTLVVPSAIIRHMIGIFPPLLQMHQHRLFPGI